MIRHEERAFLWALSFLTDAFGHALFAVIHKHFVVGRDHLVKRLMIGSFALQ